MDHDAALLRRAIALARGAASRGDAPFGAVLADADGKVLVEGVNRVRTGGDPTAHAEMACLRQLPDGIDPAGLDLYASAEPCPMCAGAIHWAGIGRVVYGVAIPTLQAHGHGDRQVTLRCAEVLARSPRAVVVVGPLLEAEALAVFAGA